MLPVIKQMTEAEAKWAGNAPEAAGGIRVRVDLPDPATHSLRRSIIAIGRYPSGRAIGDGPEVAPDIATAAVASEILAAHYSGEPGAYQTESLLAALDVLAPALVTLARRALAGDGQAASELRQKSHFDELIRPYM